MSAHSLFVPLLQYPREGFAEAVRTAVEALSEQDVVIAGLVCRFGEGLHGKSVEELQEVFTATFDMDPQTTLDLGWHLFGEDQKRGFFLAKVRHELSRHGVAETGELPDHLTHLLEVLDRMARGEAAAFAVACVMPAVRRIVAALEKRDHLYLPLFRGILASLEKEHLESPKGAAHA